MHSCCSARGVPRAVVRCSSCAAGTSTSGQGRWVIRALSWSAVSPSWGCRSRRQERVWSPCLLTSSLAIAHHLDTMTEPGPDALLFPGRDGVVAPAAVDDGPALADRTEAADRPDLRVHDLRHTGARMAARAGATLAELQERLGHSSVNAARRYQHVARAETRRSRPPCLRWREAPAPSWGSSHRPRRNTRRISSRIGCPAARRLTDVRRSP